jgi:hypothetical protein
MIFCMLASGHKFLQKNDEGRDINDETIF